jgi:hypothetical protein
MRCGVGSGDVTCRAAAKNNDMAHA